MEDRIFKVILSFVLTLVIYALLCVMILGFVWAITPCDQDVLVVIKWEVLAKMGIVFMPMIMLFVYLELKNS